jgi:hypothetical protein
MTSSLGGLTAAVLTAIAVGQAVLVGSAVPRTLVPVTASSQHRAVWRAAGGGTTTGEPPDPDVY